MKFLLDTSVLIDVLRNRNRRRQFIADLVQAGHTLSSSTFNVAELYAGMRSGEEADSEGLLAGLELYELSGSGARLAGKLKNVWSQKGRTLTLADSIVAAVAIENGCQVLTDNQKDFPMPQLQLYP